MAPSVEPLALSKTRSACNSSLGGSSASKPESIANGSKATDTKKKKKKRLHPRWTKMGRSGSFQSRNSACSTASVGGGTDPSTTSSTTSASPLEGVVSSCLEPNIAAGTEQAAAASSGDGLNPPWMDWVESGIEFFGCEGDLQQHPPKSMIGRALMLHHYSQQAEASGAQVSYGDYAKLHEDFFESLLKEQVEQQQYVETPPTGAAGLRRWSSPEVGDAASTSSTAAMGASDQLDRTYSRDDSINSEISSVSSCTFETSSTTSTMSLGRRRRRLRLSSPRRRQSRIAPIDAYNLKYNPALQPPLQEKEVPSPEQTEPLRQSESQPQLGSQQQTKPQPPLYSRSVSVDLGDGLPPLSPCASILSASNHQNNDLLSLAAILQKGLAEPASFLHPNCVLQKDKGRGDALGKSISAEGSERCLEKLREKMAIVVQVSGEEKKASTGMKRRAAKVSMIAPSYIETRSMIELRLGFLSMQYGLLLQWDYQRSGKVVFMVLRKMCHDSFYTKIPTQLTPPPNIAPKTTQITKDRLMEPPPFVVRNMVGNQAIYQRKQGLEVVLVDPPYRVPQPDVFNPSILTVEINSVHGLSKQKRWTISMTFDGHTEMAHVHYQPSKQAWEVRREAMKWEMAPVTSFDPAGLEIRMLEQHKQRKHSTSKLACSMTIPLGGLVAQPSTRPATSWQLTLPFSTASKGSRQKAKQDSQQSKLVLSLVHQSDYAHWLYQELDARRSEETTSASVFQWTAPFRRVADPSFWKTLDFDNTTLSNSPSRSRHGRADSRSDDFVDCLCGLCLV